MRHRLQRLIFGHHQSGASEPLHDRKGNLARLRGDDRIADIAGGAGVAFDLPRLQGPRHIVKAFGFCGAHAQARRLRLQRQRDAGGQSTPAAADNNICFFNALLRCLPGNLKSRSALAGDHLRLIIGFDQRQPAILSQLVANLLAAFTGPII